MCEMARVHVLLPKELLDDIDKIAGKRERSKFIAEAADEQLKRMRRWVAATEVAGSLAESHIPEWATPESTSEWVRKLREEWDERLSEETRAALSGGHHDPR